VTVPVLISGVLPFVFSMLLLKKLSAAKRKLSGRKFLQEKNHSNKTAAGSRMKLWMLSKNILSASKDH
jgi:hypothetical protein